MRVALGQLDMVWEDKEASFQRAKQLVKEAAEAKADVIIFPEMSFTGFSMHLDHIGEPAVQASTVQKMQVWAPQ